MKKPDDETKDYYISHALALLRTHLGHVVDCDGLTEEERAPFVADCRAISSSLRAARDIRDPNDTD